MHPDLERLRTVLVPVALVDLVGDEAQRLRSERRVVEDGRRAVVVDDPLDPQLGRAQIRDQTLMTTMSAMKMSAMTGPRAVDDR